ncbi:transforming acidic coiled-coil-containing protein 3-like isoform X2 [Haliotis rufescens]|uniref:transforming acidic coiled-coil-containing protein 3-like isoform X2 n=1 Tax=Haliotis rufescens TaxID=6454 RepID=UPI00201F6B8A|nr:transforming acidic coiled-coil-containing protein 3-like isoform X2 [Haliotis rufescens]
MSTMDENTPPAQMARGKTVSGSPSVRSVLKPMENFVQLQTPVTKNVKVPSQPSPLAPAPATSNSEANAVSADSDDEIQFQTKAYTYDENTDPFQSKGGLANSLGTSVPASSISSVASSPARVVDSPVRSKEDMDPFKTNSQIANSPVVASVSSDEDSILASMTGQADAQDEDAPKTEAQLQNSPTKEIKNTPIKGLPDNLDVDPFKPKSQIANSPVIPSAEVSTGLPDSLDEVDPFKSKNMVKNSPVKSAAQNTGEPAECSKLLENGEPKKQGSDQKSDYASPKRESTEGLPDSLDGTDVFKPMVQMVNSPCQNSTINSTMGTADLTVIENLLDDIDQMDPFQPKSQIMNSPVKTLTESTDLSESFEDVDPFKPKAQIQNSPFKESHSSLPENLNDVDPFRPKSQMQNSPLKETPSKTAEVTGGLPENLDDVDPFKSKSQIPNSPLLETSSVATGGLPETLDDVDPFKSKSQVPNSPLQETPSVATGSLPENLDDVDPFKSKSQIPNSPLLETPSVATGGLPENLDDIDPFKSKSQIPNSPLKETPSVATGSLPENLNVVDPIKLKSQIVNSPDRKTESTALAKPIADMDGIDPFKTKSQVMNSPEKPTTEVKQDAPDAMAETENKPTACDQQLDFDNLDPFKTETCVANSPVKPVSAMPDGDCADPFKTKSQIQNSPGPLSNADPFQTRTKLPKSPVKTDNHAITDNEIVDPFASLSKVQNSGKVEGVPFQSKSKVASSPPKLSGDMTGLDPFAPSVQNQNAQLKQPSGLPAELNLMEDPFATKLKVANSPVGKTQAAAPVKTNLEAPQQQPVQAISLDPFDNLDAFNPFLSKPGMGNTPNRNANNNGLPKTPVQNFGGMDLLGNNVMCMIATGDTAGGQEDMNFVQDDFRPANEVFSDPNVWDMLETFGSNNTNVESDLSRMSLYVKFDPLVNSKPAHSPAGIARGIQKMEVVKDGDESIMLMGTPPRGGGRRRSILVQRRPPAAVSKTIFEEEDGEDKKEKETKPLLVDLIFSCSPEAEEIQQEKKSVQTEGQTHDEIQGQAASAVTQDTKKDETFFEVVEVLKYSETDVKKMLKKLRQELTMESQGRQLTMEQELSKKQTALSVEAKHYKELAEQLEVKNKQMRQVVVEYESFINELVNEKEKNSSESKESKNKLKSERNQAIEDLQSVEKSFADLHRRYEKVKSVLEDYRKNEDTLKKTNKSLIAKMQQQDEAMNKLKTQAETKLKQAHEEREKEKSSSNVENIKLQAVLKKSLLHSQGLEKSLEQKGKEIAELTDLCDTLIAKVGGGS